MALKKDVEQQVNENYSATVDYMEQLNKALELAIKDEKERKKQEQINDALLSAWLALMFANLEDDLYNSAQIGIDEADKQLKAKNITTIVDKNITSETYEKQVQARLESAKSDLITVAEEIKSNSKSVIRNIENTITKEQQKKLADDLLKVLKENGITFFFDKAGRKWKIENYVKMRTMTETVQAQRMAFFTRGVQYGVDLVRIKHLNIHPTCQLCAPFENKILSITGNTSGYMTIQEASLQGLFHPFCDHIPEDLELAPTDKGDEGKIELNEENKKRFKYNQKRDFNMF